MKKRLLTALLATAMVGTMAFAAHADDAEKFEVAVMVKGTDSDFWQQVLVGALNYEFENEDVHVTTYGPLSESDTAEQLSTHTQIDIGELTYGPQNHSVFYL